MLRETDRSQVAVLLEGTSKIATPASTPAGVRLRNMAPNNMPSRASTPVLPPVTPESSSSRGSSRQSDDRGVPGFESSLKQTFQKPVLKATAAEPPARLGGASRASMHYFCDGALTISERDGQQNGSHLWRGAVLLCKWMEKQEKTTGSKQWKVSCCELLLRWNTWHRETVAGRASLNSLCFATQDRRIVELGSGVGLVSLVASLRGASVIATEHPDSVNLLAQNVKKNKEAAPNVTVHTQDWESELDGPLAEA